MRVVLQRVKKASVEVNTETVAEITHGFCILLGIEENDEKSDVEWLVNKICQLRVFSDHENKMNLAIDAVNGSVLVVSQFTLHAKTKKGNRPSFVKAAHPDQAIPLYEFFIQLMKLKVKNVQEGVFGEHMEVALVNDGPVTLIIDTKNKE